MLMYIIVALGAIIGLVYAYATYEGLIAWPFMGAAFAFSFVALPILSIVQHNSPITFSPYNTPIQTISDSTQVNGKFVLGTGYVNEKLTYTFYEPQAGGFSLIKRVDADGVKVFEDSEEPYLTRRGDCSINTDWVWKCNNVNSAQVMEIHVPKGSITNNIQLGK
ncbi:hypothetical protein SEA_NICEHOUSE_248 [Rhodococcus phage NiceHouse]|nr:hypothetical protein SEA_NICEHOUSE_248 [Rhodococcus phage NiceHouse]